VGCGDDYGSNPLAPSDEVYVENLERNLDGTGLTLIDAETVNGTVTVKGSAGTEVVVNIRKKIYSHSKRKAEEFAKKVKIHTIRDGDRIRIYCDYPEPPGHTSVAVSYEIECPRDAALILCTVNGNVVIAGMTAAVNAVTVNGNIESSSYELRGEGRYCSTNGNVSVRIQNGSAPLTAFTINGSVYAALHTGFSGRLEAWTANGNIHCDLPIHGCHYHTPNHMTGSLGDGRNVPVNLSTTNGDIHLSKY
jgi:DUF4097 and DUF4098 domain-containing protein YvlB